MKLRNKIIITSIAGLSFLGLQSCNNDFLETVPTSSVGDVTILATADNLMIAINGMKYFTDTNRFLDQGTYGIQGQMVTIDVMGDDIVFPNTGTGWYISEMRWTSLNNDASGQVRYFWEFWYKVIKTANDIINQGPKASGDPAVRDQAIGEAYTYRAYAYYILNQVYGARYVKGGDNSGPGAVIRLDGTDVSQKARSSVEDGYKQVWADLKQAETLLKGKSLMNKAHFNYNTVKGIQARVALTQGEWQIAADAAAEARKGYSLMSNAQYKSGFNDNSNPEWIWGAIVATPEVADPFAALQGYLGRNAISSNVRACPKAINISLFNSFPATDVRTQIIDVTGKANPLGLPATYTTTPYTSVKFYLKNPASGIADTPYMRSAEMYLIQAEALARLGREGESKAVFSELEKNRNPSYAGSQSTGDAYVQEILKSRRIELWGEGFRWYDLKRLGLPLQRNTADGFVPAVINNLVSVPANDSRWLWFIPRQELNTNPLVKQNANQ